VRVLFIILSFVATAFAQEPTAKRELPPASYDRLPIDYRVYIRNGDWTQFDEAVLKEIDQAVAWGRQYGIHVCINLHRAPGYCVNPPKEARDLWTDAEADACESFSTVNRREREVASQAFHIFRPKCPEKSHKK
jgi:hypothetical protein